MQTPNTMTTMEVASNENEISINKIKSDAESLYREGKFFCSEAIVCSIKNNFDLDMPDEMIAMASGSQ